jgi:SAM-dependent methyltransferase
VRPAARSISVGGDTVVKVQAPNASRRERLRTEAGQAVGRRTGLFVVPEILSFDDARGQIVFERLPLVPLPQALSEPSRAMELVGRAAVALAAIHGHMEPSTTVTAGDVVGPEVSPKRTAVPLHGDFGMRNVFYVPASDGIAIIDWANAHWIGFDADLGPPEIDVAVFLVSLFHRRILDRWPIRRRHQVARHFLATYSSASPHGLDLESLGRILAASASRFDGLTRRRKGPLRALAYRHATLDLRLFCRRLSPRWIAGPGPREPAWPREPGREPGRYTDSHKGRGLDYHESFSPAVNPYRAMTWRLEQRALDRILADRLASGRIAHLDFACGTGRVLGYLAGRVSTSTGVDVAASMLEVARRLAPRAEMIEADLTEQDALHDRRFDVITAFRFFPNAEAGLRQAVLTVLARHLATGGLLIFNNHKNRNSLRARLARLRGRGSVQGTMTHAEVEGLVRRAGLRIVRVYPVASLPLAEKHVVVPVWIAERLERAIGGWAPLAGIAQDVIYACARVAPPGVPTTHPPGGLARAGGHARPER